MSLTGKKRAVTLVINKTIAGVQAEGYPRTYSVLNAFSVIDQFNYDAISEQNYAELDVTSFNKRISDFIQFVELQEPGLVVENVQENQYYI